MIKTEAFTLLEILVAMLISSIVIIITYYALNFILIDFRDFKNYGEKLQDASRLHSLLNFEFNTYKRAYVIRNKIIISNNDSLDKIYEFEENFIVRKFSNVADTFQIKIKDASFESSLSNIQVTSGVIDEFDFTALLFDGEQLFHFKKKKSATDNAELSNFQQLINQIDEGH